MNRAFIRAYYSIILEEILTDDSIIERIKHLPDPLCEYFQNIRKCMLKALSESNVGKNLQVINSEVNVWRDKIIKFWIANAKKFSDTVRNEVDDIMMQIVTRYAELMGGCNTGYGEVV